MRKLFLFVLVVFLCLGAFSQGITLSFIGQLNNSEYCPVDSVVVTNVTKNWTETIVYPDTIIVVGGTVSNDLNIVTTVGLEQNVPNPFDCETRVELALLQREDVRMQLLDVAGLVCAEYTGSLNEGVHVFDISAANPQTYILNAIIGSRSYSIRMVNVGSGCGCSIKYSGLGKGIVRKFETTNEFELGDDMQYVGYATIDGDIVISDTVEQSLTENQCVTLHFTRSLPQVETLVASSVTNLSAILHGRITGTDASSIIACGFYYGTSEDDLSHNVISTEIDVDFSCTITGVGTDTTYYRAYATSSAGTGYGDVMSFSPTDILMDNGINVRIGCGESLNFYDSGGAYGDYSLNEDMTATFTGNGPVMLSFSNFDVEDVRFDYMYVYDGDVESGNLLGVWGGGIDPWSVTSYSRTMTVVWHSDDYQSYSGWEATISADCSLVRTTVATNVTMTSATLNGNVSDSVIAAITSCGFYYGSRVDSLLQNVTANLTGNMFSYDLSGLTSDTTYYYRAYAINSEDTTYGEVMSFTTEIVYTSYSNPTGYTDGYGYVDLGLPSGTKWATCNVGASTPIRYGNYYAWGETATNELYGSGSYTYSDSPAVLPASADVATASWGEGWRMPTKEEFQELNICCTVTWTTMNGVNGRLFIGPNGNSIFLPAAGCRLVSSLYNAGSSGDYWSSSLYMGDTTRAWGLYFGRGNSDMNYYSDRYYGLTVRPICVSASSTAVAPTVTTTFASNVTAMGATLSGNVTSDGGVTVFACGFLYGTDTNNLTQSVQSGSGTGSFTVNITGLADGTTYYYKAYAVNVAGTAYGNTMSFTTETIPTLYSDPTGYTDGYGYVDLGLPSGTLWATCNVGANNPEDYGDYFAWGETTTKETYNWSTYRYCTDSGGLHTHTKYCFNSDYGYQGFTDTLTTLEAIDDAAIANWGTGWRMPTQDEMYELIDNCDTTWTALNGINGMLITSRTNGNTIFLPAAGCRSDDSSDGAGSYGGYWSSSLRTDIMNNPQSAWDLYFNPYYYYMWSAARSYGLSVRAVCSPGQN